MFVACNAHASKSKQMGLVKIQQDEKVKQKLAVARAKWSKHTTPSNDGESIRSGCSESVSSKKKDSSVMGGSSRDDSEAAPEVVTKGMKGKALIISFIEEQFEKYQRDIKVATKRYAHCKQIIIARMESRSAVGIILAINEYKKLLAREATARRIVDQLETLLSEIVECVELPGTLAEYKAKVMEVLNQPPDDAGTLPLTGVTSKIVSVELENLGVMCN